jgi:hypothetical protein
MPRTIWMNDTACIQRYGVGALARLMARISQAIPATGHERTATNHNCGIVIMKRVERKKDTKSSPWVASERSWWEAWKFKVLG